jgi:hypothetical protein
MDRRDVPVTEIGDQRTNRQRSGGVVHRAAR